MRKIRVENWIKFGQCKICNEFFEMSDDFWYHSIDGYMWYESKCKKCSNKIRTTYKTNPDVSHRANKKYYESHKDKIIFNNHRRWKEKWYDIIQSATRRRIEKLWIRPSSCPICWDKCRIVAHHPDYSDRFLIVFCCPQEICISHYKSFVFKRIFGILFLY